MILQKSLQTPSYTRRTVTRSLELFGEREGALSAAALHFRKRGNALALAEGTVSCAPLAEGAALIGAEGHGRDLFSYAGGTLTNVTKGTSYALSEKPASILAFLDELGEVLHFAVTETAVYSLSGTTARSVASAAGGVCACVHYERIFTAKGCRVSYSKPLIPEDWIRAVQDAGYVELPSAGGDVLDMVSYKEKLYLFRERGITQLRALGDTLNFKAVTMPYSCGGLIAGSVKSCGEKVLFLTESGLYSFNGATCTRLTGYGASEIESVGDCAQYDGRYYCVVRALGETCVFCADPEEKAGHFIRTAASSVAGGDALYLSQNGLYRLTGQGFPKDAREGVILIGRSMMGLSEGEKLLDTLTVEGEGSYTVEARSEKGVQTARGRAGESLRLAAPLRGNAFSLKLKTYSADAVVRKIVLSIREENKT